MPGFDNSVLYFEKGIDPRGVSPVVNQMSAGKLLIGSNNSPFVVANTLTAGSGIGITNGNGTISLSSPAVNCAFRYGSGIAQLNSTGDGTSVLVQFPVKYFDYNNDFDGTSTFTAPVTGLYYFTLLICLQGFVSPFYLYPGVGIAVDHSGVITGYTLMNCAANGVGAVSGLFVAPATYMIEMIAGDTAQVSVVADGGAKTVGITAGFMFSGYLIR
jgi:hypothetical protein